MSSIIVTHHDVDGVLAASLLLAGTKTDWAPEPVRAVQYRNLDVILTEVLGLPEVDELYVTDLGVSQVSQPVFEAMLAHPRFHFVDHHSMSPERAKLVAASGWTCWLPQDGERACSTELSLRALGESTNTRFELLAGAARVDDFNELDTPAGAQRLARELTRALMPQSGLPVEDLVRRLVPELRAAMADAQDRPFTLSRELQDRLCAAAEVVEAKQRAARDNLQVERFEVQTRCFGNLDVASAPVDDVLFGKPGVEAVQAGCPHADVAVAFFDSGECWVFPRGFPHGEIDLQPVLMALGGGGRDGGGGFDFRSATHEHNYRLRVECFLTALRIYGNAPELEALVESRVLD